MRRVGQYDEVEKQISGPGEALNLLGTDDVVITGDFQPTINVKDYGPVSIPITVTNVINRIKTSLADKNALIRNPDLQQYQHAFQRITNVVVGSFSLAEAGHAYSKTPHTIYINLEGMRQKLEEAVNAQVDSFTRQYGTPPEIADDSVQRMRIKAGEMLWNQVAGTVAHESRHARDFQDLLRNMMATQQQSGLGQATEPRAEAEESLVGDIAPVLSKWLRNTCKFGSGV